jgi:hypothetical protein
MIQLRIRRYRQYITGNQVLTSLLSSRWIAHSSTILVQIAARTEELVEVDVEDRPGRWHTGHFSNRLSCASAPASHSMRPRNAAQELCLAMHGRQAQIVRPQLRATWATKLVDSLLNSIPPIPLFLVPGTFPLLNAKGEIAEMFALKVSHVEIGEHTARIDLSLLHGDVRMNHAHC